jgi:hypothetical protein
MPVKPAPGTFVLHSNALPALPAGPYVVHAKHDVAAPGATAEQFDSNIEITAPRFSLPPDQVLSTFPPNQAQGAFSARLPQIVLKRRTLPWERELDGKLATSTLPRNIPWMALVLLADGEYDFRPAKAIADCVTPGVVLEGRNDVAVADAVAVTQTVIDQVFPTKAELPLLAHVREVDLDDTELAMGDDDGWLAVVLSNRLPQGGVHYRACLISLEGQYDVLPDSAGIEPDAPNALARKYVFERPVHALPPRPATITGSSRTIADAWSTTATTTGKHTSAPEVTVAGPFPGLHAGIAGNVDLALIDPGSPQYVFPVLAQWQFTCTGNTDFQALMEGLDVGMLDTVLLPMTVQAGAKPPPPRSRPDPEVTATGHIGLSHLSREGEPDTVWYRGPLVPHPGGREMPDASGVLPLLNASDQARRIGPDGRENLSLAAAFEIGRLLALAEPSVVAAFLNWRKEGFEQARRMALISADAQLSRVDLNSIMAGFAARMGNTLLADLGAQQAERFGALRPSIDGGCPIAGIDGLDAAQLIATGFGLSIASVRALIDPGGAGSVSIGVPVSTQPSGLEEVALNAGVELGIAREALAGSGTRGGKPDALDGLLGGRTN